MKKNDLKMILEALKAGYDAKMLVVETFPMSANQMERHDNDIVNIEESIKLVESNIS